MDEVKLLTSSSSAPLITSLTPNHGLPGASVVIAGGDFGEIQGTSTVKFGATTATVARWSWASIACQAPAMASGATTVAVTVGAHTSNAFAFTVDAPTPTPTPTAAHGARIRLFTPPAGAPTPSSLRPASARGRGATLLLLRR